MEQINAPIIIKADPGGDLNTWGIKINVNYDNQEQFYLDATNAINYILDNMGITRAEIQDLLDEGEVLVTDLNGKIVDGTVLLSQLNNAILTGDSLKTNLELTITNAETAQTNLETATTNAITANDNLDTAITTAGTTQTALDLSISNAIIANNNLDTAITNAGTAQTNLQGVVDDANNINTTLGNAITTANNINTTLLATISTADTLKTGLDASIATGTQLKDDIDSQIAGGDLLVKGAGFDNGTYPNIKAITDVFPTKTDNDYIDGGTLDGNTGTLLKTHRYLASNSLWYTPKEDGLVWSGSPNPSSDLKAVTNRGVQEQIENLLQLSVSNPHFTHNIGGLIIKKGYTTPALAGKFTIDITGTFPTARLAGLCYPAPGGTPSYFNSKIDAPSSTKDITIFFTEATDGSIGEYILIGY